VPGLSIRANGSSLPLVLIKRPAHVRAVGGEKFRPPFQRGRGALGPGGHRSAPTEAAAETLDGIFDATEVSSELSCPTAPSVYRPLV